MALDQRRKRQNIASEAVTQAERLYDAIRELGLLADEAAQAGSFVDADFNEGEPGKPTTDIAHLTPAMLTTLLGTITTAARTWAEGATVKPTLMQVRR
jgi:hypothetical protein